MLFLIVRIKRNSLKYQIVILKNNQKYEALLNLVKKPSFEILPFIIVIKSYQILLSAEFGSHVNLIDCGEIV